MTEHPTVILAETAARLAEIDALARDVNDPQLAEWVCRLSSLMHAMLVLVAELPSTIDGDPRACRELPRRPAG